MRYFRDFGSGIRILCSRSFWREFVHYWSRSEINKRMEAWVERQK